MGSKLTALLATGGILACFLCASYQMRAKGRAIAPATTPINTAVPSPVRAFLHIEYSKAVLERQDLPDAGASDFLPEFTLLYYSKVPHWRNPDAPAWMVGYRIARSGQGTVPINRLVVIEENGMGGDDGNDEPLARLPEKCAGDNAVAFELLPGTWAFAVTRYEGRHAHYDARVFTLSETPSELLDYGEDQKFPEKRCWYSTLYFIDANDDRKTDVVVDRLVRDFEQKVMWREFLFYEFDAEAMKFAQGSRISEDRFREILSDDRNTAPSIRQEGIPFKRGFEKALRVIDSAP